MALTSRRTHRVAAAAVFYACTALVSDGILAQEVVVNPSPGVTKLDLPTLRTVFGMRITEWPNGSRIHVFVLDPGSRLHREFVKKVLQVFPYQLTQAWDRLVFSGSGQAPVEVGSVQEMYRRVAETPGAIGYLPREAIGEDVLRVEVVTP